MAGIKGRKSNEPIKICRLCGREFQPKVWNSTICSDDHYKTCEICGQKYMVKKDEKVIDIEKRKTCYNPECIRAQRNKTHKLNHTYHKTCIICGEEFEATRHNINICPKEHHRVCSICGEDFILVTEKGHLDRCINRDYCYKSECIEKHKVQSLNNNKESQKTWFGYSDRIYHKTCIICGKEFDTESPKRTYCYNDHHATCKICGKDYIIKTKRPSGKLVKVSRQLTRNVCYNPECKKEWDRRVQQEIANVKYNGKHFMATDEFKEKSRQTRLEKYGSYLNLETLPHEIISQRNQKFTNLLSNYNIQTEFEFPIDSKSYDIHILNTNILIEIDPTYTHNSTRDPMFKGGYLSKAKSFDYHQNKTKTAEENDYQCFHIFDWDNEEKIALQFSLMNKINQNNTYIKEISKEAYDSFMNTQIHKVNNILSDSIRFGLYLKDTNELVFVISLKLLSNNSYKIEEYMDSKYFSIECIPIFLNYFIENYKPNIIAITHDNSKFNGNYLTKLGFKLFNYGDPEVNWNKHNKKEYYKGKFLNTDLFINSGFVEVYDCGQSTWIWNKG